MIIGITGSLGGGKGTVVDYLTQKKGFKHYSVSRELKRMLDEKGLSAERKNLSAMADELAEKYDGGILEVIYKDIKQSGELNVILESIHRESEAAYLKSVGAFILGVDADTKVRYERAIKRKEGEKDDVTFEQFLEDIKREEEGKGDGTPNIRAVLKGADAILHNDGTLEELYRQIEVVVNKINI